MRSRVVIPLCALIVLSGCASTNREVATPVEETSDVIINVVGDVHGESAIKREALLSLKKYFADGDLNIFNLETAITDENKKEEKEYNFKANGEFLNYLKSAGLNVATIANNHSYDFGEQGFLDTLQNLDKAGISYVGGGVNRDIAYQGQVYRVKGLKIGVLGIAKVNGGPLSIAGKEKAGTTNGYDSASTERAITELRKVSDIVVLLPHWGEEGSFCPRDWEIASAKKWQTLGADIIVGSHTHTLQKVELQGNKLIAYSMGNFIFYSNQIENRTTGILKIRISPTQRISYGLQPFVIDNLTKVPVISDVASNYSCEDQANTTVR
jgi:poly-gamma-glutamate capsule biosynthesis protein CapA/YwtB (metallophosphatase superfamily)